MSLMSKGSSSMMASFGDLVYLNKAYILDNERSGTVRWIGETEFKPGIEWFGVELTKGIGKNNGTIRGIRYFDCQEGKGVFVKIRAIIEKISDENLQKLVGMKRLRSRRDLRKIPAEFSGSSRRSSLENKKQASAPKDFKWSAFPDRDSVYGSLQSDEMTAYITQTEKTPFIWSKSEPILDYQPEPPQDLRIPRDSLLELEDEGSTSEEAEEEKRPLTPKEITLFEDLQDSTEVEECISASLPNLNAQKKSRLQKTKIPGKNENEWKATKIPARNFFENLEKKSREKDEDSPSKVNANKAKYKWEVKNRRYLWPVNGGGVSVVDVNYELKVPPSAPEEDKEIKLHSSQERATGVKEIVEKISTLACNRNTS